MVDGKTRMEDRDALKMALMEASEADNQIILHENKEYYPSAQQSK
jgi:hypothetical protein